jgi:hypothetical protein
MTILAQIKKNPVRRVDYAEIERETNRNKRLVRDRIDSERKKAAAKAELKKLKAQNARFDEILAQVRSLKKTYDGILKKYKAVVDNIDENVLEKYQTAVKKIDETGILEKYHSVIDKIDKTSKKVSEIDIETPLKEIESTTRGVSKEIKAQIASLDSAEKYKKLSSFLSRSIEGQIASLDSAKDYAKLSDFLSTSLDGILQMLSNIPSKIPEVDLSKVESNLEILLDDNTKEWVFDIERGSDGLITRVKAWQTM